MEGKYLDPKADLTFKKVFGEHEDLVMSQNVGVRGARGAPLFMAIRASWLRGSGVRS